MVKSLQKACIIAFAILSFCASLSGQRDAGMPSEPGKCYKKCLITGSMERLKSMVLVPRDSILLKKLCSSTTVIIPKSQEWVKKKADKNCLSVDPNDCLVWCLMEVDSSGTGINFDCPYSDVFIDAYLNNPDGFHVKESIDKLEFFDSGGITKWKEVICEDDPDYKNVVKQVQEQLQARGYNIEVIDSQFGAETKAALVKFQQDNYLPIGNLDNETLDALLNSELREHNTAKYCKYTTFENTLTRPDTLEYTGYYYLGHRRNKLNFADYLDLSTIKPIAYNPTHHRHAIVLDEKFDNLYAKSPEDFGKRKNTVIYDIVVREAGTVTHHFLCPSYEGLSSIQTQVEEALSLKGYDADGNYGNISKRSLAQFQIANDRRVGFLDLKTLVLLGVEY